MKTRIARFLALSLAGACFSTAAGAASRTSLSGGPVNRAAVAIGPSASASSVTLAADRTIRPLAPGEMIVLGPTAGPVSTSLPPAPPVPLPAAPLPPVDSSVDAITVRAPASGPEVARASATGRSWESYRSGNVVQVALPRN